MKAHFICVGDEFFSACLHVLVKKNFVNLQQMFVLEWAVINFAMLAAAAAVPNT